MASDEGFFSRWSRRKALTERAPEGPVPAAPDSDAATALAPPLGPGAASALPPGTPVAHAQAAEAEAGSRPPGSAAAEAAPPPPTLDEARALTPQDDFRRFVTPQVDPQVRNTALKRLFADPHFNVMDRLDVYIDDYGQPDPLPAGMLRQMAQSAALGLFAREPAQPPVAGQEAAALPPDPHAAAAATPDDPLQPMDDTAVADPAPPDDNALPRADAHAHEGPADEDPDLRLQPHDAAGHRVDRPHPGGHAGREH
jgi:hypothetical protein